MKALRRMALGAAVAGALALGLLTTSVAWAAEKMDVRVVNTPAEAIPVAPQGTTTVAGSVEITNTPAVRLEPGASIGIDPSANTVRLANDAASPVVVRSATEPTLAPFERQLVPGLNVGDHTDWYDYTVPAGKILVVEHVSVWLISEGTPVTERGVLVRVGYVIASQVNEPHDWLLRGPVYLPLAFAGTWGTNRSGYVGNQPIRAYVPPGDTLRAVLSLQDTGSSIITAYVTIIGHLVDAPQ